MIHYIYASVLSEPKLSKQYCLGACDDCDAIKEMKPQQNMGRLLIYDERGSFNLLFEQNDEIMNPIMTFQEVILQNMIFIAQMNLQMESQTITKQKYLVSIDTNFVFYDF